MWSRWTVVKVTDFYCLNSFTAIWKLIVGLFGIWLMNGQKKERGSQEGGARRVQFINLANNCSISGPMLPCNMIRIIQNWCWFRKLPILKLWYMILKFSWLGRVQLFHDHVMYLSQALQVSLANVWSRPSETWSK